MRPILPSDLDLAARVLMALPQGQRAAAMALLLARADLADRYRKRLGRLHAEHGDGSLRAVTIGLPRSPARAAGPDYCAALAAVLAGLAQWRARLTSGQEDGQETGKRRGRNMGRNIGRNMGGGGLTFAKPPYLWQDRSDQRSP